VVRRALVPALASAGLAAVACSLATSAPDVPGAPIDGRDAAVDARGAVDASGTLTGACGTPSAGGALVINEVGTAEDPDWFELWNGTDKAIDLSTYAAYDKPEAKTPFPAGTTIAPGEYKVFETGGSSTPFPFGLSSTNGDALFLVDAAGTVVDETATPAGMERGSTWARTPDGDEAGTFVLVSTATRGACNSRGGGSVAEGGVLAADAGDSEAGDSGAGGSDASPTGGTCAAPRTNGRLVVNEVVSTTTPDRFELYNGTLFTIDLSRLRAHDGAGVGVAAAFPAGATIAPGAYAVFTTGSAGDDFPWGLSSGSGDSLTLLGETGTVVDTVTFGALATGQAWARVPDGEGALALVASPTLGACNVAATDAGPPQDAGSD